MIRLVSTFRRRPDLSRDEFVEHWRTRHAELIRTGSTARYVSRYEQMAVLPAAAGEPDPVFDGVVVQEFESREAFDAHMVEPDFAEVMADIERFIDPASIQFVLTEEPYVVIGEGAA